MVVLLLGCAACGVAVAEPDRESLLEAWEAHVISLPGTATLESTGDGVYQFEDTDLPYKGELRIVGALVRSTPSTDIDAEYTRVGMVDFQLVDLPAERLSSQSYYYWLTDRQMLYYFEEEQRWVDSVTYQALITEQYSSDPSSGTISLLFRYGIWVPLIALLGFVLIAFNRQVKKSRGLMDETAAINQRARENIDRAAKLQDEMLESARQSRELQAENNEILKQILSAMKR
jgi:hypothetical protein